MAAAGNEAVILWKSQPKQIKFLRACGLSHPFDGGKARLPIAKVVGYGGAAGGGKSDALLMAGIIYALSYKKARIGYFRQTFSQLEGAGGAIMRSMELLTGIAKYNATKHVWKFPNGSIIKFAFLDKDKDVHIYQSQQFEVLLFDEATQFSWHQVSYMINSRMRSVRGYPTFAAMATNPGGKGHSWFKKFFVQAGPPEVPLKVELEEGKFQKHIFIPSRLADNLILEKMDPEYRKSLENLPEHLRKQLLEGDWDTAEGMAFEEWREPIHVVAPFKIPDEWIRFRSLDWGHAKPYSVGWYAVDHDGRMYKYRELYGWGGSADKGTREDPEDVAKKIMKMEKGESIRYAVADDAVFGGRQDNSPSIGEQFAAAFGNKATHFVPVGKGPKSRISGKLELHHRLKWTKGKTGVWDGELPMLVFFNTCKHTIRTLPMMVLDEHVQDDIDTTMEDHAYDETRYAAMSRPMKPKLPEQKKTKQQQHKEALAKKNKHHRSRAS